jgi:4-hydroxybenzoate polyprenyltransferase
MRYFRLFLHMIRYKSALVLVLFALLSIVVHDPSLQSLFSIHTALSASALVFVYACATCINDLADWKIDAVNLKGHADRPLVTGEGSRKDLVLLLIATAVVAIGLAAFVSPTVAVAVIAGLILNAAYSLPPIQISYRAVLTPFYLALCYVLIPYLVGYGVATGTGDGAVNWQYFLAFYFLFLARISLKDFRDRKGDALAGKPTMILKYGKNVVCGISVISASLGGVGLIVLSGSEPALQWLTGLFVVAVLVVEYRLYAAASESLELLSIGYGARMGNGMLFAVLGTFLLRSQGALTSDLIVFYSSLAIIYGWLFWQYVRHPEAFYFGTKKVAS